MAMEMMRALRIHEQGGPEGLVHEQAPVPEPGIGDVLVQVSAASFTPTELTWPSTWVDRAGRDRTPVIPGHEVCGTVAALGYGTTGFGVGDAVYGLTDWYRNGAAAEYVAVEARNLAATPPRLDDVEAAALPMPALTASQALFEHGGLASGQTALVLGAAGGVGAVAVQLCRAGGARVVGAARSPDREFVRELGVDEFIDLDRQSLENATDVDLVFDLLGGEVLGRSWSLVRSGGIVVSVVEDPATRGEARSDARSAFFVVEARGSELAKLSNKIEGGQLRPVVGEVRPLAEGREAFASKQAGGIRGKVVLRVVG